MKKTFLLIVCCLTVATSFAQKNPLEGFKQDKGVWYKFDIKNQKGTPVKKGDVLVGNLSMTFGDSLDFDGFKVPSQPMFLVDDRFRVLSKGDLMDGLLLMKKGEVCTFAFPYDSIKKVQGVPDYFKPNMYAYLKVSIEDIRTQEDVEKEHQEKIKKQQEVNDSLSVIENNIIEQAAKDYGFKEKDANGVYIKMLSSGNGTSTPKDGDIVKVHYVGRLIDGTLFDTSVEEVAKSENTYQAGRPYEPLEFTIGKKMMIPGFEHGVTKLKQGDKAVVLFPSSLGYRDRDMGTIKPYSPLMFEIEVVEIKSNN